MNLGSWIILAIVVAILALAVEATFFKGGRGGNRCGRSDADAKRQKLLSVTSAKNQAPLSARAKKQMPLTAAERESMRNPSVCGHVPGSQGCAGCTAYGDSATARNAVVPIVRPVEPNER